MKFCIIGAGNVATHFAIALEKAGHAIAAVYSRTLNHAQELADRLECAPVVCKSFDEIPEVDACLFAVSDSALEGVMRNVWESNPVLHSAIFIHTAGSVPLSVAPSGSRAAVLYPLMTLSRDFDLEFSKIPLFIEGSDTETLRTVVELANNLSAHTTVLDSENRRKMHLAAVFANNFTNHCLVLASKLLKDTDVNPDVLIPILDETVRKLHFMSPNDAQTGPAKRWDENVMKTHLEMLRDFPEMADVYRMISRSIHNESISLQSNKPLQSM